MVGSDYALPVNCAIQAWDYVYDCHIVMMGITIPGKALQYWKWSTSYCSCDKASQNNFNGTYSCPSHIFFYSISFDIFKHFAVLCSVLWLQLVNGHDILNCFPRDYFTSPVGIARLSQYQRSNHDVHANSAGNKLLISTNKHETSTCFGMLSDIFNSCLILWSAFYLTS